MHKISLFFILFFATLTVNAQTQQYSRIRIYTGNAGLKELARKGVAIDHGLHKKGVFFESDFSESEIEIINESGYNYDVIIEDVKLEYKNPSRKSSGISAVACTPPVNYVLTPDGFEYGSMGGFYTYTELLAELDTMKALYPDLITSKAAADVTTTIEGRPIYFVKISDNADTDEQEPEALYTALHHAREPAGMQQLIFYMYYLLENYYNDPEIQYLVDNTELYFIPCVNPDGYIENETTDPTGGGMWRKNKRNNGNGTFGVDLNRNYGYFWGYDNDGSSPNGSSDAYRGTSGFSEPETQAIRNFVNQHQFRVAINYHTYGNYLIHPWGYESTYTPDSAVFTDYAALLTKTNNYNAGTALQTVGYVANGGSDDWMYGDITNKPKIFSFTPEAGDPADGFWPASFLIEDICKENIGQNLTTAHLILKHSIVIDTEPQYITQNSGYLNYSIKRMGLDTGTFTVSILPVGSGIALTGSSKSYSSLQLLEERNDSISFTLSAVTPGQMIKYAVQVSNGLYTQIDTITKFYGQPVIAFSSTGTTMSGFSSSTWDVTNEDSYSPSSSITDSPYSTYDSNTDTYVNLLSPVNLSNTIKATLTFYAKWDIEAGWDYAQLQVTTNNGANWTPLCGKYTKTGNQYQDPGQPVYDGTQTQWIKEEIDLSPYINENIKIRFAMVCDGFVEMDGFYFDDLRIETVPVNVTSVEQFNNVAFAVYPNPSKDVITIQTEEKEYIVTIYNQLGEKVKEESAAGKSIINVSELSAGVYYVRLSSDISKGHRIVIR